MQADHDSSGVIAAPVNDGDFVHLKGTFPAPPDTPYAGGTYQVDIQIPEQYPFKSPTIRFDTKIWHPNISSQTVRFFGREAYPIADSCFCRAPSVSIPSAPTGLPSRPSKRPCSPSECSSSSRTPRTRKTQRWQT